MLGGGTESEQHIAGFDGEVGEGIEEEPEESDLRGAAGWKMYRFVRKRDRSLGRVGTRWLGGMTAGDEEKKGLGRHTHTFCSTTYIVDHTQRHRWLRLAAGRHHLWASRNCV